LAAVTSIAHPASALAGMRCCYGYRLALHDHQISQAQFEARGPTHAPNDDLSVEVQSSEQIFDRDEPLHLFGPATWEHTT